ncbi:hypothetical protein FD24_GL002826 [Lactiplantibacillus pentosus DSM 20314]|uniref:Uncharacterized protein n=1 Tax=Lactiplantibacillus pentosus DSM 20314 TaxID=1423791 RepID=A0A837RDJ2_LACPE|nr:hypothetical protein FD24_GL002826 [Lactiplantibacillus pentosus DSM 20314]
MTTHLPFERLSAPEVGLRRSPADKRQTKHGFQNLDGQFFHEQTKASVPII